MAFTSCNAIFKLEKHMHRSLWAHTWFPETVSIKVFLRVYVCNYLICACACGGAVFIKTKFVGNSS